MTPQLCAQSPKFCCTLEDNALKLKAQHNYMFQAQGQMGVCNLDWVDFVVWTKKGMSVERIGRDQNQWCGEMVPKLKVFDTEGVVAELFYTSNSTWQKTTYMIVINKSCIAPSDTIISHAKVYCTKLIHKLLAYETLFLL